ncbi:MAG: UvrB/UvrC motif-containing protein, partial [Bacillota bacterium]|nr:UvrB/UvrC motif-containing protein [Bacillota bacterium]
ESCGLSYREFGHYGKFGCSDCYTAYGDNIRPLFRKIHGSNYHQGKVPQRSGHSLLLKKDVEKLRKELQQLINQEEFEQAAVIRDKIKELEKELDS